MAATPDNLPVEFSWQAHPAGERRGAAMLGLVIIVAMASAILLSFESYAWSAAAIVVLVVALNRFYFRSRFRIDPEGITARYPLRSQRCRWADVPCVKDSSGANSVVGGRIENVSKMRSTASRSASVTE